MEHTQTAQIAALLHDWIPGCCGGADDTAEYEIAAVFAHDYEHHVLVWQWFRHPDGIMRLAGFGLWFITVEGFAVPVKQYPRATHPPLIDAAAIVMKWSELVREQEVL